jgi:hypothetical protein
VRGREGRRIFFESVTYLSLSVLYDCADPLRSVIDTSQKQEIPFTGYEEGKMKPKTDKRILGILAAVFVLIFSQLPIAPLASGAFCSWPGEGGEDGSFTGSDMTLPGIDMSVSELSQNNDPFPSDGSLSPHETESFLEWKGAPTPFLESISAPTIFPPNGLGTWLGETSNMGGGLRVDTSPAAPIHNSAWLLASGVLALIALKRRKPKA